MLDMISWFASGLSLFGYLLNSWKKIQCWPVWILSNVVWAYVSYKLGNNALLFLQFVCMAFGVYGWRQWSKDV